MTVDGGLHDAALHASTPAVDDTDLAEPRFPRGGEILSDDRRHVAWREGMEIELGLDWKTNRLGWNTAGIASRIVRHVRRQLVRRLSCGIAP